MIRSALECSFSVHGAAACALSRWPVHVCWADMLIGLVSIYVAGSRTTVLGTWLEAGGRDGR